MVPRGDESARLQCTGSCQVNCRLLVMIQERKRWINALQTFHGLVVDFGSHVLEPCIME